MENIKYSKALILRINELYHDKENKLYVARHSDIYLLETERWHNYARKYIKKQYSMVVMDYGTGTGFVPSITTKYLKNNDLQICIDISNEMLKQCETNISSNEIICVLQFIKSNGSTIPVENNSVDIITLNSVLHHLPDIKNFAIECSRVLKPNGLIIVAHEPNSNIKLPFKYQIILNILSSIFNTQLIAIKIIEQIPLVENLLRKFTSLISKNYKTRNKMLKNIAEILLEEKLTNRKLRGTEIQNCVDIQVIRGGIRKNDISFAFQNFEIKEWTTKNFIKTNIKGLQKWINHKLETRFPENGQSLGFILQKKV